MRFKAGCACGLATANDGPPPPPLGAGRGRALPLWGRAAVGSLLRRASGGGRGGQGQVRVTRVVAAREVAECGCLRIQIQPLEPLEATLLGAVEAPPPIRPLTRQVRAQAGASPRGSKTWKKNAGRITPHKTNKA